MRVIGITGGSGSGKSTVSRALEEIGYTVLDADKIAREIVMPGEEALSEIRETFGEDVIQADGTLHRKALAKIVFSDAESLEKLNQITHRHITKRILSRMQAKDADYIIDAPLLYESGLDALCDVTIGVTAARDVRTSRIIKRDNLSEVEANMRLDAQDSIEQNLARTALIIDTTIETPASVFAQRIDDFVKGAIHEGV